MLRCNILTEVLICHYCIGATGCVALRLAVLFWLLVSTPAVLSRGAWSCTVQ